MSVCFDIQVFLCSGVVWQLFALNSDIFMNYLLGFHLDLNIHWRDVPEYYLCVNK